MIELIPAIDIINGCCVRLTKGDYTQQTTYSSNPVEIAKQFEAIGYKRLHVVDLDGAKSNHIVNKKILCDIAENTNLIVDFGGGIKTDDDIQQAFDSGADMVTIGSVAVSNPDLFLSWVQKYGEDKIILGADVKNGSISINGWQRNSNKELLDLVFQYENKIDLKDKLIINEDNIIKISIIETTDR